MQDKEMCELIENAMKVAQDLVMKGEEAIRAFLVEDREGNTSIVMAPAYGYDADTKMIAYLKLLFAILGVQAYCMISEAWVSTRATREGPAPSEDPNRKEMILALGVRRVTGESGEPMAVSKIARAEIMRNPTAVGKIDWCDGATAESRFMQMLPPAELEPCPDIPAAMEMLQAVGKEMGVGVLNNDEILQEIRKGAH